MTTLLLNVLETDFIKGFIVFLLVNNNILAFSGVSVKNFSKFVMETGLV